MEKLKSTKKFTKRQSRKTIAGIKLPPVEPTHVGRVKTIIDVDPAFFSLVEGRPIRPKTSLNLYKKNIKNIALKRALQGFLVDEILRIDREIETETSIYESTSKHFDEYQTSFDKFLADDNNKTISIMRQSDTLAKDLMNQAEEHKQANYEVASLKSKLQYTDETLAILLSIQNFLHKASPILWQENQQILLDIKHSDIVCINSNIFREIDISLVEKRLIKLPSPKLYFQTPEQLLTVFNVLEKQNLNYLLVTEELNSQKNKFLKALDLLKMLLSLELDFIQQKINETENMISCNEIREIEVREIFYKIVNQKIRYLVSSETTLQIYNYVEFAYEHLISTNDTKLSTLDMAVALEREYDNLMLDISVFDLDLIKDIEKETYETGVKEIKQAKEAAKLLKDIDKLSKRLKSSYEPSRRQNQNI